MPKIKVGILGATSYTGVELTRLLSFHAQAEIAFVSSQSYAGQPLSKEFPELSGICDMVLCSPDDAKLVAVDVVFSCLPHAVSAEHCLPFILKGTRIVDLSADFRIKDVAVYESWYKTKHPCPQYIKEAVYGLCEVAHDAIATAQIVASPGCYPTSILLPILPLLSDASTIITALIADSKSGVSGAGRTMKTTSLFAEAHDDLMAYSVGRTHRHVAEIEQELNTYASIPFTFSPHLIPMNRGMLSTLYISINKSAKECESIVKKHYEKEPFIRIRTSSDLPHTRYVVRTNYCDIAFTGEKSGQVIALSAIDNLGKGASGQALQSMNIMFGLQQREGLIR